MAFRCVVQPQLTPVTNRPITYAAFYLTPAWMAVESLSPIMPETWPPEVYDHQDFAVLYEGPQVCDIKFRKMHQRTSPTPGNSYAFVTARGGFNGRPLVQWPTRPLGGWALEAPRSRGPWKAKFDFGWGSAPDPTGGAYSAPPDPLAGFEGPTSKGGDGREKGRG